MLHQGRAGAQGQIADIEIAAKELVKTQKRLNEIYSELTGQSTKIITRDLDRDFWMTPIDAVEYGLIDEVAVNR
jgi:ATP-dependent Clp protease protease subunit